MWDLTTDVLQDRCTIFACTLQQPQPENIQYFADAWEKTRKEMKLGKIGCVTWDDVLVIEMMMSLCYQDLETAIIEMHSVYM